MKHQLIDDRSLTAKLDGKAFQLDNAELSTLLRRKAIGRLVVGLQYKLAFCIQRHAMGRRAALEIADAARAESRVSTVAGGKTREDDIPDHGLKRCRKADDVALAIGQEGDRQPVRQQTVWDLRQFERLIMTMPHGREHPAPRPVQGSIPLLDRHDAVCWMLVVAGILR